MWARQPWQQLGRRMSRGRTGCPGRGRRGLAQAPPVERWPNSLVTLAIETSCDDTCVAILEKEKEREGEHGGTGPRPAARPRARLLFEGRVTADNRAYGGIHPPTATESHHAALGPLVQQALGYLPGGRGQPPWQRRPDFVSVTRGPGMRAALATGLATATGLAAAWDVPLVGVHHMQAHALTPRLVQAVAAMEGVEAKTDTDTATATATPAFPYLSLLVSGGHTLLVHTRSLLDHRIVAQAANIAIGDLLDKCARAILPAGYIAAAEAAAGRSLPYGALLERFAAVDVAAYTYPARRRDECAPFESGRGWRLEAPMAAQPLRRVLQYNFSGLNGAVLALVTGGAGGGSEDADGDMSADERRLVARGTMLLAFEHLASRLLLALADPALALADPAQAPTCVVVSGGVASNGVLRHVLRSALDVRGYGDLAVVAPPARLCTDNAAMIAWTGMEMYEAGWRTALGALPARRWSMDAAVDGGILGVDGWVRGGEAVQEDVWHVRQAEKDAQHVQQENTH